MDRRKFLLATGCTVAAASLANSLTETVAASPGPALGNAVATRFGATFRQAVAAVEKASGGRLGLSVIDTGTGERFGWRADERFPMCSTFKAALAAAILKQVEAGRERLDRRIAVAAGDIVSNSPFCQQRVGGTASIAELCRETITVSDNAAANLLLRTIGGPAGFTRRLQAFGDAITRLDNWEPEMGEGRPGDLRDTTTPEAMAGLLHRLTLGNALAPASRAQLVAWMKATRTSGSSLRAGLPKPWLVADKTGTGGHGTTNIIATVWPQRQAPLVIASYLTGTSMAMEQGRAMHAQIGRAITAALR